MTAFPSSTSVPVAAHGFEPVADDEVAALRLRVASLERALVEASASESDASRDVLRHAPVIWWEMDADGLFVRSEGAGLDELGLGPGDSVGRSVFDMYREYPDVIRACRRALAGEEFRAVTRIGEMAFDTQFLPLRDPGGGVVGVRGVSLVVTERHRLAKALQRSEERLIETFRAMPCSVVVKRLEDGTVIEANDRFLQMSGRTRDEVVGRPMAETGWWVDLAERADMVTRLRSGESVRDAHYHFRRHDGTVAVGRVSADIVTVGGERCVVVVAEDVTERLDAQEAARVAQARFETLARIVPAGIFHTDAEGRSVYVNAHYRRMFGVTGEDVAGAAWVRLLHPEDRQRVFDAWGRSVSLRGTFQDEYRVFDAQGSVRWVATSAAPEFDAQGNIVSFVGVVVDVTPLKTAEDRLQRLNERLEHRVQERTAALQRTTDALREQIAKRLETLEELDSARATWDSILENLPASVMQVAPDGTIEAINRTWPHQTKEQVLGTSVYDYIPAEEHERTRENIRRTVERGETAETETSAVDEQGRIRWYRSWYGPVRRDGVVTAVCLVATEVTEEREARDELRQRHLQIARLSRAAAIGETTAALAHEINNPLSAVSHFARGCVIRMERILAGLQDEIADPHAFRAGLVRNLTEMIDALRDVSTQAHRASETVRGIRRFLQNRPPERRQVSVDGLLDEALALIESEARRRAVRIVRETTAVPLEVHADPILVQQVLFNLFLNAVEAMEAVPADGRRLVVGAGPVEGGVEIRVVDSGPGIPEHALERIFEPFHTTKPGGTGMGLAVCRTILRQHDSVLRVGPGAAGGTRFAFVLGTETPPNDGAENRR